MGATARHLREVLHASPGQPLRIGVLNGGLGTGVVEAVEGDAVVIACTIGAPPERPRIDVLLALPRPKVLKRLWAQLAALGVGRVILTNAARVERSYFDTHVLDADVYTPLLIEGLQQARDTHLPAVSVHRQFRKLVEDELDSLSDAPQRLLADPGAHAPIRQALAGGASQRVLLAIGPEGGWNDFERAALIARGCVPVSMGARTLRTDTATIALLALVRDALED